MCELVSEKINRLKRLREKRDCYELMMEEVQEEIDALEEELEESSQKGG